MRTHKNIADALQEARRGNPISVRELTEKTGLTSVTIRGLLGARTDPRLTTLMAVAGELGLEVRLVPKAAQAIDASQITPDQAPA